MAMFGPFTCVVLTHRWVHSLVQPNVAIKKSSGRHLCLTWHCSISPSANNIICTDLAVPLFILQSCLPEPSISWCACTVRIWQHAVYVMCEWSNMSKWRVIFVICSSICDKELSNSRQIFTRRVLIVAYVIKVRLRFWSYQLSAVHRVYRGMFRCCVTCDFVKRLRWEEWTVVLQWEQPNKNINLSTT